jgi:5-methylthioadenosine/S-adenosylhomocysteine deaminase
VPLYDPESHLVYAARSSDVRHVVVDGRVVVEERRVLTVDEAALRQEVQQLAQRIRRAVGG